MSLSGIGKKWPCSYLNNGKQYVELRNNKSSLRDVVCGVPQGSILGPLLFMIYINDICNASENLALYADDTTFNTTHNDIDILLNRTNMKLKKLHNWLCLDKLSFNVDLLNYMLFSTKKIKLKYYLNVNNNNVKKLDSTKCLVVHIDEKLTWKDHMSDVCTKIECAWQFRIK